MNTRWTLGSMRPGRSKFPCSRRLAVPKTSSKSRTPSGVLRGALELCREHEETGRCAVVETLSARAQRA